MTQPSPELAVLTSKPHGVFTTAEARAVGYTSFDLVRLVAAGCLDHLARGLYAVPATGLSTVDAHRRLAAGVCRAYPDAVLTAHSAAVAHGLPVFDLPLDRVIIARPVPAERLGQHWITRPTTEWLGSADVPVGRAAALPATVVTHAMEHGIVAGVVALDFALHEGMVTIEEVEEVAGQVRGWPRSHRVRSMIALADGLSESVGESRVRVDLAMAGLEVDPQEVIRDESGRIVARPDLRVRGTRVLVEFDGRVKYADGDPETLFAEKRREDELRRLGYVVVRLTWADLYRPGRVVARVRAAIAATHAKVDLPSA